MLLWNASAPSTPIADANWFVDFSPAAVSQASYWASLPSWCTRIVLGYNQDEAALFLALPLAQITASEADTILLSLSDDARFSSGISSSRLIREAASPLHGLIAFTSQVLFIHPTIKLADTATTVHEDAQIWVYELAVKDPLPGPLQGFAWHSLSLPLMFRQPPCMRASPEFAATAEKMSQLYTAFLYGEDPWEA